MKIRNTTKKICQKKTSFFGSPGITSLPSDRFFQVSRNENMKEGGENKEKKKENAG